MERCEVRRVQNYDFWHDIWMPRRHEVYDVFSWLKSTYRPDADRILDLGAGTGAVALRFLRDVRRLLAPGGLFLYGDIVKFEDPGREDHAFTMWNDDIRDKFVERKLELRRSRDTMRRNLMEAAVQDGDLPMTIDSVLASLDRAGFARSSLVWFYLKYAVFVAVAP